MSSIDATTALATPEQYRAALLAVRNRMDGKHLAMLEAHHGATEHTINARRLAAAVGYSNYSTANLQYRKFARWLADELGYTPDPRPDGSIRWWMVLSYACSGSEETRDGEFQWIMRPELVKALETMRWVVATPVQGS